MSLLQHPRRPSSDHLDPGADMAIELDRELDLSAERPSPEHREGRGPGILVAAIVASSLSLAGVILLMRGDGSEAAVHETAAPPLAELAATPTELAPLVVPPPEPAPPEATTIASRSEVAPLPSEPSPTAAALEITPASIAPASIAPAASATVDDTQPVAEPESDHGAPFGRDLPVPTFDEPTAQPEPEPEPAAEPLAPTDVDDASGRLPGIEEAEADADAEPDESDQPDAAMTAPDIGIDIDIDIDIDEPIERAPLDALPVPA